VLKESLIFLIFKKERSPPQASYQHSREERKSGLSSRRQCPGPIPLKDSAHRRAEEMHLVGFTKERPGSASFLENSPGRQDDKRTQPGGHRGPS
jgi:hypothetical protein